MRPQVLDTRDEAGTWELTSKVIVAAIEGHCRLDRLVFGFWFNVAQSTREGNRVICQKAKSFPGFLAS